MLETSLGMDGGGAAAQNLAAFNAYLRHQVLNAQFHSDAAILERQLALILGVREAWCSIDAPPVPNTAITSEALSADARSAQFVGELAPPETSQWSACSRGRHRATQ
jgi:hypothetical protein